LKNIINISDIINFYKLEEDIFSTLDTIKPNLNRYDIIFESPDINMVINSFINNIEKTFEEDFSIHVKLIQSYIQTVDNSSPILFSKVIKREIKPTAKYSFIFFIEPKDTLLEFSYGNVKPLIGDLIIFKSHEFIKDNSNSSDRIALLGSITNDINYKLPNKTII
jgi:hypothetical protein